MKEKRKRKRIKGENKENILFEVTYYTQQHPATHLISSIIIFSFSQFLYLCFCITRSFTLSLSLSIYIYIYVYVCIFACLSLYMNKHSFSCLYLRLTLPLSFFLSLSLSLSFSLPIYIYLCISLSLSLSLSLRLNNVKLVENDPKAPFSIATTPRFKGRRYSIPWIFLLYPWFLPYNTVLGKAASSTIF